MSLRLDPVMQLVWAMANAEACAAGARRIEPAFFLVALLKVADEEFTKQIGEFSLPDSIKAALRRESMQMRRYLEASRRNYPSSEALSAPGQKRNRKTRSGRHRNIPASNRRIPKLVCEGCGKRPSFGGRSRDADASVGELG